MLDQGLGCLGLLGGAADGRREHEVVLEPGRNQADDLHAGEGQEHAFQSQRKGSPQPLHRRAGLRENQRRSANRRLSIPALQFNESLVRQRAAVETILRWARLSRLGGAETLSTLLSSKVSTCQNC